jgi:hypothetical protein
MPDYIDYLQIDIDCTDPQIKLLQKLIQTKKFSIITFEHDAYLGTVDNCDQRIEQRRILHDAGYELVVNDVSVFLSTPEKYVPFEDWWVNPNYINSDIIQSYKWIEDIQPKYYNKILFNF